MSSTTKTSGSSLRMKEQDGLPTIDGVNQITVSDNTLTDEGSGAVALDTGGGGGGGGLVYVNDVTPSGSGNVGSKTYQSGSGNEMLLTCASDTTNIRVYVIATIGPSNLRPNVTVAGTAVGHWNHSAYDSDNRVMFRGYANITHTGGDITVTHEDGATTTITVSADTPPVISSVEFTGGYPGTQTEVKENDHYDIRVQTDIPFTAIEVENSGACKAQSLSVGSTADHTFTANIADRGDTATDRPARVRVQKSTGAWSDWVYTDLGGVVEGTNVVKCNNLHPSIETMSQADITYPASQEAIKDSESVTVHSTCTDYTTITYSSPNGQLTIPNTSTYAEDKTGVARNTGDYNVTASNYRISANRADNDSTTTKSLVVYIAHTDPTITMSEAHSRLRTGGNDGTSTQNHTITLTASQRLISAPTIAPASANGGTWSGSFIGGPTTWTRTLRCNDTADLPGTYSYNALSATNLAGKEVTSYTGASTYVIGGFVSRTITLAAFANESSFGASVSDYTKCSLTWNIKALSNRRAYNSTVTPDANSWCMAGTIGSQPTLARILDTAASSSSSNESSITVEENI